MNIQKTADALITELMAIHPKGFDLSLERILGLLEKLGNPQNKLPPVIHVAGTNGKGSAIAFTRAILEAAGLAVHVHTSPHLVNWHERYRMGQKGSSGQLVSDAMLADAIARVAEANGGQAITVFEVLTVVTFILFSENPADVCLIEVGLGGRFDATNVMETTDVSIITPVSIDHEAFLGDTLAKIAFEKAGIIKRGVPLVVGPQEDEALEVIERQAAKQGASALISGQHYSAFRENGRMIYQDETSLIDIALPALRGEHQIDNAATAITASRLFASLHDHPLTTEMIETGLKNVQWPGRMQRLSNGKLFDHLPKGTEVWLDGGHNPGAAAMIADFMGELSHHDGKPQVLICGMLDTKDPSGYFEALKGQFKQVITVPIISSHAGIPADKLAGLAAKQGFEAKSSASLVEALKQIDRKDGQRVLIAGSLYLAGDALAQNETPPR